MVRTILTVQIVLRWFHNEEQYIEFCKNFTFINTDCQSIQIYLSLYLT